MSFFTKRYILSTARAPPKTIKESSIPIFATIIPKTKEPIISQILLANSCNPDISPLSFGLAYPITNAEVTGESIAITKEIQKLKTIIAQKL